VFWIKKSTAVTFSTRLPVYVEPTFNMRVSCFWIFFTLLV